MPRLPHHCIPDILGEVMLDNRLSSLTWGQDILKIMGGQSLEATCHMKFFWQEKMKLLRSSKMWRRYHPQVIRFALSIHAKSPSACQEIQESGALILASEWVLRHYKNYFQAKACIKKDNVESLCEKISSFTTTQKYVAVVMDEMKLQIWFLKKVLGS